MIQGGEKMDELCSTFVSKSYVQQGFQELAARSKQTKDILSRRRLPESGWDEMTIERFLSVRMPPAPALFHRTSVLLVGFLGVLNTTQRASSPSVSWLVLG